MMNYNSNDFRKLANIVDDDFVRFSLRNPLTEGVLNEANIVSRINQVVQRVNAKYHDVQYSLLASATQKALSASTDNPKITATLQKILRVGRFAMQNRAVLSILLALVSTLVGMAAHPSAASAAPQTAHVDDMIDRLLSASNVDDLIDNLHRSGIEIGADSSVLPPEIGATVRKAAQALRAIEQFKFVHGQKIESSHELFTSITAVGEVTKAANTIEEHIRVTTPDGKMVLAQLDSVVTSVNGQITVDESQSGIEFDLMKNFANLDLKQMTAVQDYIDSAVSELKEANTGVFQRMKAMITGKIKDFGMIMADAVADKPHGRYQVTISAQGVKVTPA